MDTREWSRRDGVHESIEASQTRCTIEFVTMAEEELLPELAPDREGATADAASRVPTAPTARDGQRNRRATVR